MADSKQILMGGGGVVINDEFRPYIKTAEVYTGVIFYILIIELGLI